MTLTTLVAVLLSGKSLGKYVGGSSNNKYSYNPECTPDVQKTLKWDFQNMSQCTLCHFIANKHPCENTAKNIFESRFQLFGGKWVECGTETYNIETNPNPKDYCSIEFEKGIDGSRPGVWTTTGQGTKQIVPGVGIRTRMNWNTGKKEYYVPGHYNFFQIKEPTNKQDPVVAGPNGELYCPSAPVDMDLTLPPGSSFQLGNSPADWGCSFDFQRGICFTPQKTTATQLLPDWRRSELEGNCGPLCPITGRPAAPSKVLLTVCHAFEANSCCYPNQDIEIEEFYYDFLTAGDRCNEELVPAKKALRRIYCLGCHPNSGKYVSDGKIKICKSLALRIAPEKFDGCGVLQCEERGAPWLGDDMVTPSNMWGVGIEGAMQMMSFISESGNRVGAWPPFFDDGYEIEIVDNCILDRYNPFTGKTELCAEQDENMTRTCYDYYNEKSNGLRLFVSFAVALLAAVAQALA